MKISSSVYAFLAVILGVIMTYVSFGGPVGFLLDLQADNEAVLQTIGKVFIAGLNILGWVGYILFVKKMLSSSRTKWPTYAILALGLAWFLVYLTITVVNKVLFVDDWSPSLLAFGTIATIFGVVIGWFGVKGLVFKALLVANSKDNQAEATKAE